MLLSIVSKASDFEVNGLEYTIISLSERSVYISDCKVGGDIVIPDQVMYNNVMFNVDSIRYLNENRKNSIKINSRINVCGTTLYYNGTTRYYVDESNPYLNNL